ncbi:MAG: TVP38/TMEM64 family protein [Rhodospirillales bacterium]|nr:MAG: TVP38/TMEM64 family protein [Rhodospirillales bacterium]
MTEVQAISSDGRSEADRHSGAQASGSEIGAAGPPTHAAGPGDEVRVLTPRRIIPLAVIVSGFIAFFAFDLDSYVTFESLKQNREWLLLQVAEHRVATVLAFIAIYAAIAAFSVPGATVASITGGFLFGLWFGTAWNVIAATTGATLLFLAARTVFGDILHKKAGPWLHKLEEGFQENAFNYLLALRLVPAFPFFVVNLVPAFLNVRLRTFVVTTFFGIIPGAFVYTSVGAGLGSVFDSGEEFSASSILTPEIVAAMLGLVALSLLPVAYRMVRARK